MANKLERKAQLFNEIVQEMSALYREKNKNYGDSFGKTIEDLGSIAGLVPLRNKLDRLVSLMTGTENKFESIEDSLIDLANYSIMNLVEIRLKEEEEKETKCDGYEDTSEEEQSEDNNNLHGDYSYGQYPDGIIEQDEGKWKLKDNYQPRDGE